MGKVTLAGSIPGDATNGLGTHSKEFMETPLRLVPVVAMVAVTKIVEKTETGERYPVLKVHHWELVPEKYRKQFGKMLGDALADRTGAMELPFPADSEVPVKDPFPETPAEFGESHEDAHDSDDD